MDDEFAPPDTDCHATLLCDHDFAPQEFESPNVFGVIFRLSELASRAI
jgi:hypothetical protein